MPRDKNRGRSSRNDEWGVTELVRERPIAAAAAAAGAAAAGLFLWSKRSQISQQLSNLSDQISDWTESMSSGNGSDFGDDTAGLTATGQTGTRSSSGARGRKTTASRNRGMSETGGGNASLGAHSGGIGTTTSGSPSGRGRAQSMPTT
jgi:hypothetical protein